MSRLLTRQRPLRTNVASSLLFALVLLAYFALGVGYIIRTPAWQAPDEPAHYNYIAQIGAAGCCPVIAPGDWNQAYLDELTSTRFAPDRLGALATVQFQDHQPPLYYLLASPLYVSASGNLTALRGLSLLLGAGVVAAAYGVGRVLLPGRPPVAVGLAAFVAFVPQHLAMLTSVNNDALIQPLIGVSLLLLLIHVKDGSASRPLLEGLVSALLLVTALTAVAFVLLRLPASGYALVLFMAIILTGLFALNGIYTSQHERATLSLLGVTLGLIFITKATGYFMGGVIVVGVLLRWWLGSERRVGRLVRALLLVLSPALLLALLWWTRNLSVYGPPDFLGLMAHDVVVADQPRTADLIAQIGPRAYLERAVTTTFNSFWGQFGWMALPLQAWTYRLLLGLVALVVTGLGIAAVRRDEPRDSSGQQRAAWGLLGLVIALTLAQYGYYNAEFLQLQGRYLFPALIPLGVLVALGLDGWRVLLAGRVAHPVARWVGVAVLGLLLPLNLYILWRVIPGLGV